MDVLALTIGYDGTEFFGSQAQSGRRTVQGELEQSIEALVCQPVRIVLAGRTDRGVHAAGQVAACRDMRPELDEARLCLALNARLPADLRVVTVTRRPEGFNPRFDALWREYRYRIWFGSPQPLAHRFSWQIRGDCDLGVMNQAATRLIGTHDFATFAGSGKGVPWSPIQHQRHGTQRRMLVCRCTDLAPWWMDRDSDQGRLIELRIAANGFLPQMVRNVAGALVMVGQGVHPPKWMSQVLDARDRRSAPAPAPPQGLTLWRVGFAHDREASDLLEVLDERVPQTMIRD